MLSQSLGDGFVSLPHHLHIPNMDERIQTSIPPRYDISKVPKVVGPYPARRETAGSRETRIVILNSSYGGSKSLLAGEYAITETRSRDGRHNGSCRKKTKQ